MSILPEFGGIPQLNQAYNERPQIDESDIPEECRQVRASLDDKPVELWRDEELDDHNDYEHLLHLLYVQGLRSTQLA